MVLTHQSNAEADMGYSNLGVTTTVLWVLLAYVAALQQQCPCGSQVSQSSSGTPPYVVSPTMLCQMMCPPPSSCSSTGSGGYQSPSCEGSSSIQGSGGADKSSRYSLTSDESSKPMNYLLCTRYPSSQTYGPQNSQTSYVSPSESTGGSNGPTTYVCNIHSEPSPPSTPGTCQPSYCNIYGPSNFPPTEAGYKSVSTGSISDTGSTSCYCPPTPTCQQPCSKNQCPPPPLPTCYWGQDGEVSSNTCPTDTESPSAPQSADQGKDPSTNNCSQQPETMIFCDANTLTPTQVCRLSSDGTYVCCPTNGCPGDPQSCPHSNQHGTPCTSGGPTQSPPCPCPPSTCSTFSEGSSESGSSSNPRSTSYSSKPTPTCQQSSSGNQCQPIISPTCYNCGQDVEGSSKTCPIASGSPSEACSSAQSGQGSPVNICHQQPQTKPPSQNPGSSEKPTTTPTPSTCSTQDSHCPSCQSGDSCYPTTSHSSKHACATLMSGCGNGKGAGYNKICSHFNVLTGPSSNDPCPNQDVSMLENCGNNGGSGNRVCSLFNCILGGTMMKNCGNGTGGNTVNSWCNMIGPNADKCMGNGAFWNSLCNIVMVCRNCTPSCEACGCPSLCCDDDPCSSSEDSTDCEDPNNCDQTDDTPCSCPSQPQIIIKCPPNFNPWRQ